MYIIFAGSTGNIVVCISPLTALMMDQQAKFAGYGLSTEFVGEAQTDKEVIMRVSHIPHTILVHTQHHIHTAHTSHTQITYTEHTHTHTAQQGCV